MNKGIFEVVFAKEALLIEGREAPFCVERAELGLLLCFAKKCCGFKGKNSFIWFFSSWYQDSVWPQVPRSWTRVSVPSFENTGNGLRLGYHRKKFFLSAVLVGVIESFHREIRATCETQTLRYLTSPGSRRDISFHVQNYVSDGIPLWLVSANRWNALW